MADSGTARPAYRHIAGLRKIEQAWKFWVPTDAQATPCERHSRASPRRSFWEVGSYMRRCGDAGRNRHARAEDLCVHALARNPICCEPGSQIPQERGGAAQIEIRVARHAN